MRERYSGIEANPFEQDNIFDRNVNVPGLFAAESEEANRNTLDTRYLPAIAKIISLSLSSIMSNPKNPGRGLRNAKSC